ncbi:hypothetical protein LNTAR_16132 [Lentisphaera araneosa HTCC2155]|uniref:Transcriptional regulator MraZ n=1 Tax=Lentisphaera araneosa HTCC2155 TaxID=313628 RepID=A6DMM4_9BACT|nr:division/cell wall cluster transcriptional repressor MraZ [Lentisphaera araneosa]EDM27214.1 hypothetical protein LNTAR_16132 [Lentisphaera araneosa HTCC2155]
MQSDEIIFTGEFEHSVDAQRRLAIPRSWRGGEGARLYLLPGKEKMIQIIPEYMFAVLRERLKKVSFTNPKMARALAAFGAKIQEVQCDKQGRVPLPAKMKAHAGIKGDAVLVGAVTTAQIWAKQEWEASQDDEMDPYAMLDGLMNQDVSLDDLFGGDS